MSVSYQNPETIPAETEEVPRAEFVIPFYSYILIACIVAVSAVQIAVNLEASVDAAGFDKEEFLQGEYWRILTGATLHGGLLHLAFNGYALYVLGKLIETLSNRAHLAIVFLLSVFGGGILSLIFLPDIPSIGASGGIVGFLGYLTIYGYKRRKLLTNSFLKNMVFNIVLIGIIGVFVIPNVDNFGHLGGLLAGAAYGLFQIPSDLHKDPREIGKTTNILGLISIGTFIAVSIFSILLILNVI